MPVFTDLKDSLSVHLARDPFFHAKFGSLYNLLFAIKLVVNENAIRILMAEGEVEEFIHWLFVFGLNSTNRDIVTKLVKKLVRADLVLSDEAKQMHGYAK